MSKFILSVIICVFLTYAQAQTYQLTVSNEPFVFLENPQSAVDEAWVDTQFDLPLGFNFDFFDITSDRLYATEYSSGGYTSLNQDQEHLYMLVPFYASLIDRGYSQDSALSPIYYKTEGLPGQQVFTIEYNDAGLFYGLEDTNGILLDYINFQVKLFESSGDIEFHYGPYSIQEDPAIVFDGVPGPITGLLADADNNGINQTGEIILLEGNALNPTIVTDSIYVFVTWPIPENTVYRFSRMGTSESVPVSTSMRPFLYPNPTSGKIHLNETITNDVIYPIRVMDVLGQPVGVWNNEDEISAEGLSGGSYYVIMRTKDKTVTEKLLVLPE